MKALSFRQPWAELILQGRKTLDLRTYSRSHRGELAIHAAKEVERQACLQFDLDPDSLPTGGIVGVVELVDVIPLDAATYAARADEHLGGRSFRQPLYGWVLTNPRRLEALQPATGRQMLFEVELEQELEQEFAEESVSQTAEPPARVPAAAPPPLVAQRPEPESVAGESAPFELRVTPPRNEAEARGDGYGLALFQRPVQAPAVQTGLYDPPPPMTPVAALAGDSLRALAGQVMEGLREAGYRATDLSARRQAPFALPEGVGVRLGLLFLAVRPLSKLERVESIAHAIRRMPPEELYYWYSKCTVGENAERAQKALRVMLAEE